MKLSMLHKMLLRILLPVLLGLGVMSFLDYRSARQVMEAQIQTDLETIVDTQVNELRSVQRTLTGGLRSLSHLTSFQQLIQAAEAGASKEELASLSEKASNLAASLVKDYAMIYSAALVDAKGTVLAHSAHKNIGSSYADREYFKKAMQGDDIQVQNVVSRASGFQATILAASFKNAEGKRVGMVMMTMDNAGLASMTTNQLKIGSRGFCYAYNMKGEMALHPDKSLIGRDDSSLPHVRRMLETGQGVTSYMNGEEERLLYYQALPSMHWIIIMDVSRDELFEPLATMLGNGVIVLSVCILLVGAVVFFSVRSVAGGIRMSSQIAKNIAEGNLQFSEEEKAAVEEGKARSDELSVLAEAFQMMRDNIERLLAESREKAQEATKAMEHAQEAQSVAEQATLAAENARREGMHAAANRLESIVHTLSSASTQLAAQIEQVSSTSQDSSRRLSEATAAITQMNATVQHVAQNADNAAHMSDDMRKKADTVSDIVHQSLNSIDRVHGVTTQLRDDMQELTEHAQNINQIMGVISDIADQTNLLALNAAIEAARAGEAGRGFAVVADEVRKLAEKTMASTTDVGNAIRAIQESTTASMKIMSATVEEVERTTVLAKQSGDAMQELVGDIEQAAEQVSAIADASREQSSASNAINSTVEQVNAMTTQTAESMNEANNAITELARQTQELSTIIAEMKR